MPNPNKQRGSRFELEIVKVFRYHGHRHVERSYSSGLREDRGDLTGLVGGRVCVEAKDCKTFDLSGWLAEAEAERVNAHADYGVVVAKRRGKSASSAYCIMPLDAFARLLKELEGA